MKTYLLLLPLLFYPSLFSMYLSREEQLVQLSKDLQEIKEDFENIKRINEEQTATMQKKFVALQQYEVQLTERFCLLNFLENEIKKGEESRTRHYVGLQEAPLSVVLFKNKLIIVRDT